MSLGWAKYPLVYPNDWETWEPIITYLLQSWEILQLERFWGTITFAGTIVIKEIDLNCEYAIT